MGTARRAVIPWPMAARAAVNDVWFGVTNWDTQDQRTAAEVSEEKIAQTAQFAGLWKFGQPASGHDQGHQRQVADVGGVVSEVTM